MLLDNKFLFITQVFPDLDKQKNIHQRCLLIEVFSDIYMFNKY